MFPMLMPRPSDFAMLQVSGVTDAHDCAAFTAPAARRRSAASVFFMPRIFLWLGAPMSAHPHLAAKSYSFGLGGLAPGGARQRTRSFGILERHWIPACAGMTVRSTRMYL